MIHVYHYEKCGTCRKALQFLSKRGLPTKLTPIREQPPTKLELQRPFLLTPRGGAVGFDEKEWDALLKA